MGVHSNLIEWKLVKIKSKKNSTAIIQFEQILKVRPKAIHISNRI